MRKIGFTITILFILMTFAGTSFSALAADAEYRGQEEFDAVSDDVVIEGDDESMAISIIGGADGPTSIFIAGKLGGGFVATVAVGAVLLVVVIVVVVVVVKKKRRK